MKLQSATRLLAGELGIEREGIALNTQPHGRIEKSGTQFCVRTDNPQDSNFGCWPSQEEAEQHVRDLNSAGQYGQTGWTYGRQVGKNIGYISKRETAGFPAPARGGRSRATAKGPTHKPNPSVGQGTAIGVKRPAVSLRRPRLESFADYGEPMAGAMGHGHIDPVVWFHPPSLTKRLPNEETRIPGDDPRETNDKFMDVTKRKQAQTDRMKLLKRSAPSGDIPVKTTAVAPHSGVYQALFSSAIKKRASKRLGPGQGKQFTSYERRGVI